MSRIPLQHRLLIPSSPSVQSLVDLSVSSIWRNSLPWSRYKHMLSETCLNAVQSKRVYYEVPRAKKTRRIDAPLEVDKIYIGGGTLVVIPPNLVEQWCLEIQKHVKPGHLNVLVLTTSQSIVLRSEARIAASTEKSVIPPMDELLKYDIVLISSTRFNKEEAEGREQIGHGLGRRESYGIPLKCTCPYIGATRTRNCTCLDKSRIYKSPLMSIHWKRLIVDEGHTMGSGVSSNGVTVADRLPVERRWIVTGTPTSGLVSVMVGVGADSISSQNAREQALERRRESRTNFKESQDLQRLGNIVVNFLKFKPWDMTSWNSYLTKGFAERRPGAVTCVKNILQDIMVRHLPEDVEEDVQLPDLYHKSVFLKPGFYERLSNNLFIGALAANAVTSERQDQDYIFHPSQRRELQLLIGNMTKQSGFFWTGFGNEEVQKTVDLCKKYLDNSKRYSPEDTELLKKAIWAGEMAINCRAWYEFSLYHEMGYFVLGLPHEVARSWAFYDSGPEMDAGPFLLGGTQTLEIQRYVNEHSGDNTQSLREFGVGFMTNYYLRKHQEKSKAKRKKEDQRGIPASASQTAQLAATHKRADIQITSSNLNPNPAIQNGSSNKRKSRASPTAKPNIPKKSALKRKIAAEVPLIPQDSPLAKTKILGTASIKLSYLLDKILLYNKDEKILVFFESDNVAWYIAEALDILGIQYLIYDKSLNVHRKASYIVTFHESEQFRVLLMDVNQAAHGLNVSTASRVFFVNPIWQPNIEAQALKRAHRIGQTKTVYAETLILSGTIEEEMMKRRYSMSEKELKDSKASVVDDEKMREIITRLEFLDVEEVGAEQVAKLKSPQGMFGDGRRGGVVEDADSGIVHLQQQQPRGTKRSLGVRMADEAPEGEEPMPEAVEDPKPKRVVTFRFG